MQCAAVMFGRCYFFHTADSLVGIRRRPHFFTLFSALPMGRLWYIS
jgi:hypothetical protein